MVRKGGEGENERVVSKEVEREEVMVEVKKMKVEKQQVWMVL